MNVYNLSGMTRRQAEELLINSEGRLCVRFYRRRDGTILTKDCPVGLKAIKRKISQTTVALASIVVTFLTGVFSLRATENLISLIPIGDVPPIDSFDTKRMIITDRFGDEAGGFPEVGEVMPGPHVYAVGRVDRIERLEDVKVKAWIK